MDGLGSSEFLEGNMSRSVAVFCVLLLVCAGCSGDDGPPLARVEGVVTLDGEPLPDALIEFQPTRLEGSPSYGSTDAQGRYEMVYSLDRKGAWIGEHLVRITTYNKNERVREKVPPKYHRDSEIKRNVVAGETNKHDFAIDTSEE